MATKEHSSKSPSTTVDSTTIRYQTEHAQEEREQFAEDVEEFSIVHQTSILEAILTLAPSRGCEDEYDTKRLIGNSLKEMLVADEKRLNRGTFSQEEFHKPFKKKTYRKTSIY